MEKIWNERVEAGKALWRQKYEQEQIMAFILREGLQLPEFPEPPGSPPFHKFADS